MADKKHMWNLSLQTGIEVEQQSFDKASRIFDAFYKKYNNQEMTIDTSDMVDAVKKGLAEIYRLYNQGTLDDTAWLNIRPEMKQQFQGVMSDAEAMFDGIKVLFSDGSYVSGLSDIFSKFDQQLSVVFADVGGWFDKLEVKSRDLASILENLAQGSIGESGWFNTENVDLDVQDIKDIIRTLEELQQVQSEMSRMNPQLTRENFASGLGDKELNRAIKQSSSTLNELNRLNLSTTAELELHKSLIDTLYSNKWDDDSQDYTKANAYNKELFQEQLESLQDFIDERKKLAEQLKAHEYTLFSTEDISEYLAYNEHQIEIYENYLKELNSFKSGGDDLVGGIDFSAVTKGLDGIKQVIEELKDAFKPLTDAFADSDNALNKMVTSSIDDLNSLLNKFGELYDMVDTISKKDFNITNITQQNTTDIVSNTVRQYKQVARELSKQVASLYADSSKTAGVLGSKGANKYLTLLTNLATGDGTSKNSKIRYDGFALDDINKNINKAKSLDDIDSIIDQLNYFKKLLIEFNELRNTVKPGSYVNNFKDIQKQTDLLKENVADVKTVVDESKELNTLDQDIDIKTEPILEDIKTLGDQVGTELSSIRSKIEETFNFATIEPGYENIKNITDTIYSYFTELQSKINSLELKFTAPEGIHIATEAIKEEGEAAEVSAQQKQEFLKANKDVAASGPKTKAGVKEATEAIEEEGDVAEDSVKRIAMVQQANAGFESANKANVGDAIKLQGLTQADFEVYANEIAKSKGMTVDDISVRMGENGNMMLASVKMVNEELAQSITYTYQLLKLEDDLTEAYLTGYTAKGNQNKALKIAAAAQKKADAERLKADKVRSQNNQWLIKQQKTLDSQENKYKYSSKSIDGSTALMSTETSLADDAEHTIDSLAQHIKERIKNAISNGLTNELREQILNDLRILQNEISVEQSKQYSATKMKASTVETNKKAYKEYLRAFEANAKKSNIFEVMEQDIVDLGKELEKVTDADSMNTFVDKLNVAQKKFQAEKALLAQTEAENKKITKGQSFELDVDRQFGLLTKQQAQWEKNGQLTDELRQKIESMFNALTEVTDSSGLSIWKKQWMILKDEVMQTKYEIEAANKAQQASDAVTQAERNASGVYWDGRFKDSINNLGPQKRPELEQLKVYMLQQADVTKDSVIEQYDAIMTIISNKNEALRKLMSAKGPAEQQYWQKEYSAWFGAWNALDQDVIGDFFANAGNQAMLGTDKIKKFNDTIETSKLLSAQQQDSKSKQDNQNLENAINLQNKLYAAKKQLAKVDVASAKGQELSRRIDELQEEYDTSLKLLRIDEDRQVARERELKLEKELNAIKQQTKNNQNRSYGKTQYDRELKYFDNIKAKTTALKQDSEISDLLDNKIQEYEGVLKRLENLRNTFINDPTAFDDDGLKNNFQSAALEAENLRKEILGIFKETDKLANIPSDSLMGIKSLTDLDLGSIKQEMATFIAQLTDGQFKFEGFNAAGTEMHGVLDRGNGLIEQVTVALDRGTNSLYAYQTGTKQVSNSWQNLGSALKEGAMRLAGQYIGFHEAVQALRSGITYVRDIDLALTELKKVTDETDATYKQFLKDMASTASVIGSTTKDLTNSAADWARVGYDIREAGELAKSTAVLMNVSEFDNVEAATEALTSTLQAFNYSAEDSIKIVDKLNTIGNNFAISSYGAAEGLKRSAATLVAAGNSLEESLAMLAAGNRVMQDPEAMGNALKVLSMRIRGVKTE